MKKIIYLALPFVFFACGAEETTESDELTSEANTDVVMNETEEKKEIKSPRVMEEWAGEVSVKMDYGSPRVRDRVIWGELVPYDEVWRAGANEVTSINFKEDVEVDGNFVLAGTYGLFIIPKEEGDWTIILNEEWSRKDHDVWGAFDYKEDKDVLRFDVMRGWMEESVEEMSFQMIEGYIIFEWEKVLLEFEIKKAELN